MAGTPGRSGGHRQPRAGRNYQNRRDLQQAVATVKNQPYGVAGQQAAAQRAMPLPNGPPPPVGGPAVDLPQPVPLTAPTQRPDEPVTAGLPFGAGPGPEVIPQNQGMPISPDPAAQLRAIYQFAPNDDLLDLINHLSQ